MATAPQIKVRDGSGFTQDLVYTTNQESTILQGQVDVSTVDLQVSVNGAAFASDPSLVKFDSQSFTIPNPDVISTGLSLDPGLNTILIRAIDILGSVSAASSASITRVDDTSEENTLIPTGIRLHRRLDAVDILAAKPLPVLNSNGVPLPTNFVGFNIYASTTAGGSSGYFRVNEEVITEASTEFEEDSTLLQSESTVWASANRKFARVRVTEEDEFGAELGVRLDTLYDISLYTKDLRFKSTLEERTLIDFLTFRHIRAGGSGIINSDQFTNVVDTDPLYYVVTGVYFNPITNQETETPYSQEVLGSPLVIDTSIRDMPPRKQKDVRIDYINSVQRVNTEMSLIPGSTTRDVSIDPFASEAERLYFILDFVHRSGSFLTLLQIDDANGDGVSDPVASSSYKQAIKAAIGFTTDTAVQSLIDQQFDKLAANVNKPRLPGRPSVGQVIFATTKRPSVDQPIPSGSFVFTDADISLGIPSVRYRVGGSFLLPAAAADAFYNFDTKQYEVTVDITAETIGDLGNRPAGQIKNVQGVPGFTVINREATVFGLDRESNSDLATRSQLSFVAVDTGTEGGYALTSASQIGIVKAKIVKSGDDLMMRDYDEVRHKHAGGKVDIWVQGLRERQVSEKFAFTFEIARDITCQVLDLATLTLRVQDSRVTPSTPIIEVLDNLAQGFGVHNVTTGTDYDLTGLVILDYQTFKLNTSIPQPLTSIDDIINADYRFRVVNQFKFTLQPVRRVISVVGEISGALSSTLGYDLFKTDDPLLEGESTIASNYLSINQVGGLPSGSTITVNNEQHVLIGFVEDPLLSIGVNTKTVRIFNQARTLEYNGPDALVPDFEIILGTPTTPAKIVRSAGSTIVNGSTVSVDYVHDENFTVTYVVNDLLQQLQRTINGRRHITADVVVKQAIQNSFEIETTVQLLKGATKDKTDPAIRSAVSQETNQKTIGQGAAQSDIIKSIDSTDGVDFQVVPFARMAYADGSLKLRETLQSDYVEMLSLAIGGNRVFLLTEALQFPTSDGGGLKTEHKGVFQDDEPMGLSSTFSLVGSASNQAFIIGSAGAIIVGYTDPATLTAAGFITADEQAAALLKRTANHVLISLSGAGSPADLPAKHSYACSYVIRGDSGSHDITASGVEFIDLGSMTVTYRKAS